MSRNSSQPRKFCITPHEQQIQQRQQHLLLQQQLCHQQQQQQQQPQLSQQQQLQQQQQHCQQFQLQQQQQHQQLLVQLAQQQRARQQQAQRLQAQQAQQQQQQLQQQQQQKLAMQQQLREQEQMAQQRNRAASPTSYSPFQQQQSSSPTSGTSPPIKSELCSHSSLSAGGGARPNQVTTMRAAASTSSKYSSISSRNEITTVTSSTLLTQQERSQQQQLQEQEPSCSGDSAKINAKLNEIFIKRLQEIDCKANGDADLKLVTYQEWIDMLLKINDAIINNMEDLETEVTERLECVQRKASIRHTQDDEASKYRKDICTLLKIIQNGYHNDNWNLQGLQFETIRPEQILGPSIQNTPGEGCCPRNSIDQEAAQKNKLIANMKALAIEVAEKHDEILELRRQIFCMEDEIQNAQMKIQLKDNVIKELRNDLRCANSKLSASPQNSSSTVTIVAMPPINTPRSTCTQNSDVTREQMQFGLNDDMSQFESLSQTEQVEQQKLKVLECELNELFEMTKDMKKQNYEFHKKRLSDIFQKSESEKIEAYRKLDFIRRQLIELEAKQGETSSGNWNECDSGFSSKSENDKDAKMLDGVRKRIQKLNDCSFELKKRVQQLEIENNELVSKLQMEKSFVGRNSETLKQVADLLSNMTGEQFSYNDIYNVQCKGNPFCDAILRLEQARQQREQHLCQKAEKMEECLYNKEKEIVDLQQRLSGRNTGTDAFKCQIEQLQCTIYEKENRIKQLNTMLSRLSHLHREAPSQANNQQQSELCIKQQCELQVLHEKVEQLKCKNKELSDDLENSQKQEHFLHSETRKLNDELMDSKRRNNELNMQTRRLTNLLKQHEIDRMEVAKKCQVIEKNYEEQAKQLGAAHAQIKQLQDRFCMMDKLQEEHNMERNLLREEVLALKEKEAVMIGKHKSIQGQLQKLEQEVYTAQGIIQEQQCIMQRNEVAHAETMKRLQEQCNETKRHFNMVVEDYNCLQEEYEKLNELRRQNEKVIESFRRWKEAQLKSDEATRSSFKQYEEHIRLLLEEKQKFMEKYRDLNRDFCAMQSEVDRLRSYSPSTLGNTSDNSIAHRMELLRRTSRRVAMQSSSLRSNDDSTDVHLSRSRSVQDLCF